ncbi:MAG: protein-L-isoaspartate(D-aspartate) O-methyltransferase [Candidatus Brocadiales bacterium]|nr:protein-L-isoaspartate(D-aspartate) O-methyltransferase [Candidatus Brocadiales bacterium]
MINSSINFSEARKAMVEDQLRLRDITDERVLAAMEKVPRHRFLPIELWDRAYDDTPLPIGDGQTVSQPYMVAFMTQALMLKENDKVLEVGTGSGYQAAVLAEIIEHVYTIEVRPNISRKARKILDELGYSEKITMLIGDGSRGLKEEAPYDGIIVTAAYTIIPTPMLDQLAEGGRLVMPVGGMEHQILYRIMRKGTELQCERLLSCIFVPLVVGADEL